MGTVAIQRGHCFRTSGVTGGPYEQEIANEVARLAKPLLEKAGHKVIVLSADPPSYPKVDVFVALHCDASGSPAAGGASVGYQDARGKQLADAWKSAYKANGWVRGWQRDNFTPGLARYYGVREAIKAGCRFAAIVEHGFTTNAIERAILRSPEGRARAAQTLCDAVVAVLGGGAVVSLGDRLLELTDPLMRGADVAVWQRALINDFGQGVPGKDVTADGVFGRLSRNGTERAQRRMGLDADGVVGPNTLAGWRSHVNPEPVIPVPVIPDPSPAPEPSPVIPAHDWEVTVRWGALPDEGAARVLGAAHGFLVLNIQDAALDLVQIGVGYTPANGRDTDIAVVAGDRTETAALVANLVRSEHWGINVRNEGRRLAGR